MRYIRYAVLAIIAIAMVTVALANRGPVTLSLMPEDLASLLRISPGGNSVELPLFVVIFAGILAGVLLGFVWEWLREHKHRAAAAEAKREAARLNREMAALKTDKTDKDDVLALLDQAS